MFCPSLRRKANSRLDSSSDILFLAPELQFIDLSIVSVVLCEQFLMTAPLLQHTVP
jgi:hypothetical protein